MGALVIPPSAILADIARHDGITIPPPASLTERDRLVSVGVNPTVARYLARRIRNMPFTPATTSRQPQPCGTHAAYNRHRAHGETPDHACIIGERRYQNRRRRMSTTASTPVHNAPIQQVA